MKFNLSAIIRQNQGSHPTRGAWIEMPDYWRANARALVAPHTGCVD